MRRAAVFLIISSWILMQGCDTTSSIDPPDDSFFLKFYGGEGNQTGVDAVLNADGTVTLFGNTQSISGQDLYLVNVEPNGRIVWEKTMGGALDDSAKDIELTTDGRLVILSEYGPVGSRDIVLMTLSSDGNKIDSTLTDLAEPGTLSDEVAISVTQTSDGFIVAGSTNNLAIKADKVPDSKELEVEISDAIHVRYFDDLTLFPISWKKASGRGIFDQSVRLIEIPPSAVVNETRFYLFGFSDSNPDFLDLNPFILGLGATGEPSRSYSFEFGTIGTEEKITNVIASTVQSGEGFVLAGTSSVSASSTASVYMLKMRKTLQFDNNDKQFEKVIMDIGVAPDDHTSVFPSASSGFLVLANDRNGPTQDFSLTKVGIDGALLWSQPILFGGEHDDSVGAVFEFPDGSIGIVGTFSIGEDGETKMTFIKVNQQGKFSQ